MIHSSSIVLGLLELIIVALSITTALGLLGFMSVKTTPIITDVVLLLLLTVGIGNLSSLMGAYEVSDNTYSL